MVRVEGQQVRLLGDGRDDLDDRADLGGGLPSRDTVAVVSSATWTAWAATPVASAAEEEISRIALPISSAPAPMACRFVATDATSPATSSTLRPVRWEADPASTLRSARAAEVRPSVPAPSATEEMSTRSCARARSRAAAARPSSSEFCTRCWR